MKRNFIFSCISIIILVAIFLPLINYADGKLIIPNYLAEAEILLLFIIYNRFSLFFTSLFKGKSSVRQRRALDDDFNDARKEIEELINDSCKVDGDCNGSPVVECVHDGSVRGTAIGECKFTWWFILILVLLAVMIIGAVLSCLCSPCCCLYDCLRKLCCCCC